MQETCRGSSSICACHQGRPTLAKNVRSRACTSRHFWLRTSGRCSSMPTIDSTARPLCSTTYQHTSSATTQAANNARLPSLQKALCTFSSLPLPLLLEILAQVDRVSTSVVLLTDSVVSAAHTLRTNTFDRVEMHVCTGCREAGHIFSIKPEKITTEHQHSFMVPQESEVFSP